mmetsp:Transcript_7783/g.26614  ORF Transcript_7783/g.26614 Transcript_7783/m.26614 type:complete len:331 (+) Transcript_7783:399-1391(+)
MRPRAEEQQPPLNHSVRGARLVILHQVLGNREDDVRVVVEAAIRREREKQRGQRAAKDGERRTLYDGAARALHAFVPQHVEVEGAAADLTHHALLPVRAEFLPPARVRAEAAPPPIFAGSAVPALVQVGRIDRGAPPAGRNAHVLERVIRLDAAVHAALAADAAIREALGALEAPAVVAAHDDARFLVCLERVEVVVLEAAVATRGPVGQGRRERGAGKAGGEARRVRVRVGRTGRALRRRRRRRAARRAVVAGAAPRRRVFPGFARGAFGVASLREPSRRTRGAVREVVVSHADGYLDRTWAAGDGRAPEFETPERDPPDKCRSSTTGR